MKILGWWSRRLPDRILKEDFGDYLEDINKMRAAGEGWRIWPRVLAVFFWTGVNAIGYLLKKLRKRSGA